MPLWRVTGRSNTDERPLLAPGDGAPRDDDGKSKEPAAAQRRQSLDSDASTDGGGEYAEGRASVEQQLDVYINDLAAASAAGNDAEMADVLAGLRYVMDYRIRGGQQRHLDKELCRRLLEALLLLTDDMPNSLWAQLAVAATGGAGYVSAADSGASRPPTATPSVAPPSRGSTPRPGTAAATANGKAAAAAAPPPAPVANATAAAAAAADHDDDEDEDATSPKVRTATAEAATWAGRQRLAARRANEALVLIYELAMDVVEFRRALATIPLDRLRAALKLHVRFGRAGTDTDRAVAAAVLRLATDINRQAASWRDLIEDDHDAVQAYLDKHPPPPTGAPGEGDAAFAPVSVLPPPALYAERRPEAVVGMFRTSATDGLTAEEALARRRHYGKNAIPPPPRPSVLRMLLGQILDFMIVLLIVAATVSAATGDVDAAIVLMVVVVLNVILGFSQEYKANRTLQALMKLSVPRVRARRAGEPRQFWRGRGCAVR